MSAATVGFLLGLVFGGLFGVMAATVIFVGTKGVGGR